MIGVDFMNRLGLFESARNFMNLLRFNIVLDIMNRLRCYELAWILYRVSVLHHYKAIVILLFSSLVKNASSKAPYAFCRYLI